MSKKWTTIILAMVLSAVLLSADGLAATISKLNRVRSWQHKGYTRLVLDAEGARPLKIGPATAEGVMLIFKQLKLMQAPAVLFGNLTGAIAGANHNRQTNRSVIAIKFKSPDTAVKSFYLSGKSAKKGAYRLILDFYPPQGNVAAGPGTLIPVVSAKVAIPTPTSATATANAPPPRVAATASKTSLPAADSSLQQVEIQSEAPQTASPSTTDSLELASGQQKYGVPPAKSPATVRPEGEKQNVYKLDQSETTLQMGATEPSANRNEPHEGNDQTMAALKADLTMAGKPDHISAAQAPHSGTNHQAPGILKKAASGAPVPSDIASRFKNLGSSKKEANPTGQPKPFGIEARSVSISPAVEEKAILGRSGSYQRADSSNKQKSMGLVELTLKLLSIILSCLVILFLYRANKIANHRYQALKQIQLRLDNQ